MKLFVKLELTIFAVIVLAVCITSGLFADLWNTTYQFYPSAGYYNGQFVYYLMTDVSDANYALTFTGFTGFQINYTPRLAYALSPVIRVNPTEFIPSVYYVTNVPADATFDQKLIFSAQWPAPYLPQAGNYMPLWRLKTVTWAETEGSVLLTSVADIEAAEEAEQVTVEDVGVVVGASILINSNKVKIPQAYVSYKSGYPLVRLPIKPVFIDGLVYKMLQLDYSNKAAATSNKATYAPLLAKFYMLKLAGAPTASQFIYTFWPKPPVRQLSVAQEAPLPFGYTNENANYSPLMNDRTAQSNGPFVGVFTSEAAILTAVPPFKLGYTTYIDYQPVVGQ